LIVPVYSPTRIRGHHLLCLLTYSGKGYGPAFTENFDALVAKLNTGNSILEIVAGPDDICARPALPPSRSVVHTEHCDSRFMRGRDTTALHHITCFLRLPRPLAAGLKFYLAEQTVQSFRQGFAAGTIRRACKSCAWHDACSEVAGSGYATVKLHPPRQRPPQETAELSHSLQRHLC